MCLGNTGVGREGREYLTEKVKGHEPNTFYMALDPLYLFIFKTASFLNMP
jgi:hypothetical protein